MRRAKQLYVREDSPRYPKEDKQRNTCMGTLINFITEYLDNNYSTGSSVVGLEFPLLICSSEI